MTSADDLLRLAGEVEAAEGPSLALDIQIENACVEPTGAPKKWLALKYSSSLDAAMTLVYHYGVLLHLSDIGADGLPLCNIGDRATAAEFKGVGTANLPLAVCAAALRARAAIAAIDAGRGS